MHHFPGSKDAMAVSANKAGEIGAAGSLALDGKMSVPTVTIITNNASKTNTVCKFNVMSQEDNFE